MGTRRVRSIDGTELRLPPRCRKRRHPSREDAERVLPRMYRKDRKAKRTVRVLNVYFCTICDGWHLGKKPRGRKR